MDAEKQRGLEDQPTKRGCELHLKFKIQENKTLTIKDGFHAFVCTHTHAFMRTFHQNAKDKSERPVLAFRSWEV